MVKQRQTLAEKILTLHPDNQKIIRAVVEQFLIAETAKRLDVEPKKINEIVRESKLKTN